MSPGILDAPIAEKSMPMARDFEVRAVYLTGVMAGSDQGLRIIRNKAATSPSARVVPRSKQHRRRGNARGAGMR